MHNPGSMDSTEGETMKAKHCGPLTATVECGTKIIDKYLWLCSKMKYGLRFRFQALKGFQDRKTQVLKKFVGEVSQKHNGSCGEPIAKANAKTVQRLTSSLELAPPVMPHVISGDGSVEGRNGGLSNNLSGCTDKGLNTAKTSPPAYAAKLNLPSAPFLPTGFSGLEHADKAAPVEPLSDRCLNRKASEEESCLASVSREHEQDETYQELLRLISTNQVKLVSNEQILEHDQPVLLDVSIYSPDTKQVLEKTCAALDTMADVNVMSKPVAQAFLRNKSAIALTPFHNYETLGGVSGKACFRLRLPTVIFFEHKRWLFIIDFDVIDGKTPVGTGGEPIHLLLGKKVCRELRYPGYSQKL